MGYGISLQALQRIEDAEMPISMRSPPDAEPGIDRIRAAEAQGF